MKVLVTGGAGYIGSHVVRELMDSGHDVTIVDNLHVGDGSSLLQYLGRSSVSVEIGDIRNANYLDSVVAGQDKVVHLAAIVGEPACDKDEKLAEQINVQGSANVLNACLKHKVKQLVFLSTASSYGVQDDSRIATELTPTNPISFYAKTKLDMEEVLLNSATRETYVTILRPSTVYGTSGRMRFDLIANTMTKTCFLDKKLNLFGLSLWRPIFWVGDAGRAICQVIEADDDIVRNQIYNCGNNSENYQIRDIGESVASVFDDVEISYDDDIRDARSYKLDFTKFEDEVGFKISRSLKQATIDMKLVLEKGIIRDPNAAMYYNHRVQEIG